MNSFGRQEGGGFRRREGKLVSPVRRDYPLHQTKPPQGERGRRNTEEGGAKPPLKSPPERKERRKREGKGKRGREREGEKKTIKSY